MSVNIVTGMTGIAHITSDDDRTRNASYVGDGKFVLPFWNKLRADIINNNLIRIQDGMLMNQGTQMGIEPTDYEEVVIENGLSGTNRNDLIVMRYEKQDDTGLESASLVVIKGTSGDTAVDPEYVEGNILDGGDLIDDMPLYRVKIESLSIVEIEPLFEVKEDIPTQLNEALEEVNSKFDGKMDKTNPAGSGSFSMNRKDGTYVGDYSHTEGIRGEASANYSHVEGYNSKATEEASHAEGMSTTASGANSHAEGASTTASGRNSHAEGASTTASGQNSHAEGVGTTASGPFSHASGSGTVAGYTCQAAFGRYNENKVSNLFEVGNGSTSMNRNNAFEVTNSGDVKIGGDFYDGAGNKIGGISELSSELEVVKDTLGYEKINLAGDITDNVNGSRFTGYTNNGGYPIVRGDFKAGIYSMSAFFKPTNDSTAVDTIRIWVRKKSDGNIYKVDLDTGNLIATDNTGSNIFSKYHGNYFNVNGERLGTSFKINEDCSEIIFGLYKSGAYVNYSDLQIERGSEATEFAPYVDNVDTRLKANETALLTTKTATGNPISISDSAHVNAEELTVELEPKQDLHGYDKPWVGGAGKNKFNKNGSLETNKFIQADGTLVSSTNWNITDYQQITPNTYTMSGATKGDGGYYGICWYDSEKTYISGFQKFAASPQTVTIPSNAQYVRYSINNSALDIFMLEEGSTATSYAPYSNICPISGRDETDLVEYKKNLSPNKTAKSTASGYINTTAGKFGTIQAGETYTLSLDNLTTATNNLVVRIMTENDYVDLGNASLVANGRTSVTFNSGTYSGEIELSAFVGASYSSADVFDNIQLELGSTATTYEPYIADTYTLQFGDTVYGGTLNVLTGVLTVDRGSYTFNGSEDWTTGSTSAIADMKEYTIGGWSAVNNAKRDNGIANYLNRTANIHSGSNAFYIGNDFNIAVNFASDVASLKTYLANNPLQLVYELATPYTIQLTPQQIKMLKGNNVLVADGEMELTYQVDSVVGDVKEWAEEHSGFFEILFLERSPGVIVCSKTYEQIFEEYEKSGFSCMNTRYVNDVDDQEFQGNIQYNADNDGKFSFFYPMYLGEGAFAWKRIKLSSNDSIQEGFFNVSVS